MSRNVETYLILLCEWRKHKHTLNNCSPVVCECSSIWRWCIMKPKRKQKTCRAKKWLEMYGINLQQFFAVRYCLWETLLSVFHLMLVYYFCSVVFVVVTVDVGPRSSVSSLVYSCQVKKSDSMFLFVVWLLFVIVLLCTLCTLVPSLSLSLF